MDLDGDPRPQCVIIPHPASRALHAERTARSTSEQHAVAPCEEFCPSDYELLDRGLRSGWLVIEHRAGDLQAQAERQIADLCDKGLVCRQLADPPAWRGRSVYVVTEWGHIVWRRARARSERQALRRHG